MTAKRLLVSLNEQIFQEIENLAKINHSSLSKIAKDLIVSSLELEEDKIFSKLANDRINTTEKWISHEEIWK